MELPKDGVELSSLEAATMIILPNNLTEMFFTLKATKGQDPAYTAVVSFKTGAVRMLASSSKVTSCGQFSRIGE